MAITISGSGITSANIADGTIVNADINSSAAIDGSKLTGIETVTKSATDPDSPAQGDMWFDTTTGVASMKVWNGTAWDTMSNKFSATGGTTSTYSSGGTNYKVHTFTSSGTFTAEASGSVDVLVVAGGGGGGARGGGGGAGGFLASSGISVTANQYSITIGAGGATSTNSTLGGTSYPGTASSGLTLTPSGGGYGGNFNTVDTVGGSGSSGGGAARDSGAAAGSGITGQGFGGGTSANQGCSGGGGGGGAGGRAPNNGEAGGAAAGSNVEYGGNGGVPKTNNFKTGSNIYYAGGGGGGTGCSASNASTRGLGGGSATASLKGGGGDGANGGSSARVSTTGVVNTGGGGGGGGDANGYAGTQYQGAPGGSGIVIIRYTV